MRKKGPAGPRRFDESQGTPRVGNQRTRGAGEEVGNPGGPLEANWPKTGARVIAVVLSDVHGYAGTMVVSPIAYVVVLNVTTMVWPITNVVLRQRRPL